MARTFQIVNGKKWFYFSEESEYRRWLRAEEPLQSFRYIKEDWQGSGWYRTDTFDRESDYVQQAFVTSRSLQDTIVYQRGIAAQVEKILQEYRDLANEKPRDP